MKCRKIIVQRSKVVRGMPEEGFDPVPSGSPMQTAQLIGALVIRFVMHAQSGDPRWETFPDMALLEAVLNNCMDREYAEYHLAALLFHHSKILDNCGKPNALRRLAKQAFPKVIEDAKWEMLPEKT
jgi:hypothetical protein